jgi:hypothetical protein
MGAASMMRMRIGFSDKNWVRIGLNWVRLVVFVFLTSPSSFWGAQPPRLSFDAPPRRTLLPPRRENAKPGHATGTGIKIRKAGRQERAEGPNFKRQTPGVHISMVEECSFITREYDSSDLKENGTIPF